MSSERLLISAGETQSEKIQSELLNSASNSLRQCGESTWIFEQLPKATIVSVSRPDTGDISPILLSYTIDIQYKQFNWRLVKKASQVLYLHFALKKRAIIEELHEKQEQKRAIIEELHEKQEQVKEWLQSMGIVDHTSVVQDDDEPDDGAFPLHNEESVRNRNIPSSAVLPIICPALGGHQLISDKAKVAMQGYLNHFLGNMDIVNSREYGPKLKEGYVLVKHLRKLARADSGVQCCPLYWFSCCEDSWEKVWGVLKPGFLALLNGPFDTELLDIIFFDVLPTSDVKGESHAYLANHVKERNPLRYSFKVPSGNGSIKLRTSSSAKVKEWVAAINATGLRPQEGWCHPHRFDSFAPQRGLSHDESQAQWFIDGQAAFEAIASFIENAKSEIFITGWWLCPELYLRRPFQSNSSSRLDALLEAKAQEGVQIYILLYKEVPLALKINSMYSKKRLLNIHENVRVMRYPDHMSTGVYYWSHHEKLVIVDYQICFIGGLDLCFGRYDTMEHKVGDCPACIWPGKDYYNPRESEPNSWEDTMKDELEREKYPRMPWHDVHCALWGPPCHDIARHFVQRWNHAKKNKAPNEQTIPLLMPHQNMVIPHYMGSKEINIPTTNGEQNEKDFNRQDSFSSRSPSEDIPLLLPQEADGLEKSDMPKKLNGLTWNYNLLDHQMNGFVNDFDSMDLQSEKVPDETGQVGPRTECHCQVIRSVSYWSAGTGKPEESIHRAYCSLIKEAKHFIYIENQFFISGLSGDEFIQNRVLEALYGRILQAHKQKQCFRVIIVLPLLPGFQGGVDDYGAATVRALMHWQYRTISWTKTSIIHKLNVLLGSKTHDYISFYGLRSYGRLFDNGPLATSQVYVHSKLMIIDDRIAVIGSSNINDRSLLGSRDSEIGIVIEDKEFIESSMNGKPWKAGKFTYSLRRSLWSEHLGLTAGEISRICDPVAETTYKDLWSATAKENTVIYQDVFACIPNDTINSRAALRQSVSHWKEKLGHTTIDLGIAPEKLQMYENGELKEQDPMERLKSVKGHLVCFPLEFMRQEDLRPVFNESEFYAAQEVFH